jgi:hypothetical protein
MAESKGKLVDEVGNKSMYRGRGYIQLTGKNNYEYFGKKLGIDLVKNPELANDPEIAAKIVPLFYAENRKWRKIKGNYEDFDNVVTNDDMSHAMLVLKDFMEMEPGFIKMISNDENWEIIGEDSMTGDMKSLPFIRSEESECC